MLLHEDHFFLCFEARVVVLRLFLLLFCIRACLLALLRAAVGLLAFLFCWTLIFNVYLGRRRLVGRFFGMLSAFFFFLLLFILLKLNIDCDRNVS